MCVKKGHGLAEPNRLRVFQGRAALVNPRPGCRISAPGEKQGHRREIAPRCRSPLRIRTEYVRMAATNLGHASLATTERHYNQARSIEAAQHFQGAIGYLRAARKQKWCAR
jgi:hypothetical protein